MWMLFEDDPCAHGRHCHECGIFNSWDYFYNLKHGRNGYGSICKQCKNRNRTITALIPCLFDSPIMMASKHVALSLIQSFTRPTQRITLPLNTRSTVGTMMCLSPDNSNFLMHFMAQKHGVLRNKCLSSTKPNT